MLGYTWDVMFDDAYAAITSISSDMLGLIVTIVSGIVMLFMAFRLINRAVHFIGQDNDGDEDF